MSPAPGEMLLRFVGDRLRFSLRASEPVPRAFLRTNLGRGSFLHGEIVQEYREELTHWGLPAIQGASHTLPRGMAWRDIPMRLEDGHWTVEAALAEVGFFNAKGYLVDAEGRQIWPGGADLGITVHPSAYRTGNTIYCAFTRMFGETKTAVSSLAADPLLDQLDQRRYAVIPPSGKFRDLLREFPHIFGTLGCRILHLLPVNPAPTTYARFGRFGSPYACEDLTAVDPALVEFDRRTTGIEQFEELTYAAHRWGGLVFLDLVINHTGWGSTLQENHPEWFLRKDDGSFESPGAWGTTWEDLVELDHRMPLSWDYLADVFITWCRRGVDGFRCDAGYKVPVMAWRYITAKVRHEFPNALFLLEGLGGAWEATEELLTRGGMQWAYSELFQNYSPAQVSGYFDHTAIKGEKVGVLVHYSETHDNERLAARGRTWSLLRNQLCALASQSGGFGYTCGVEWLAAERVNVHSCRGLSWNHPDNIVPELARLSRLLLEHPCFFDGAEVRRLSGPESNVFSFTRRSASRRERLLILVNLDPEQERSFFLALSTYNELGDPGHDLLTEASVPIQIRAGLVEFRLRPGQSLCLSSQEATSDLRGDVYRLRRAQHAWAMTALAGVLEPEQIGPHDWAQLAALVEKDPRSFLASLSILSPEQSSRDLIEALGEAADKEHYTNVVEWGLADTRRVTPVPPKHWLLVHGEAPFRATLSWAGAQQHGESVPMRGGHCVVFPPSDAFRRPRAGKAGLRIENYGDGPKTTLGSLIFLREQPEFSSSISLPIRERGVSTQSPLALLTNGRGGMARLCVDLGSVKGKYDCVLGANLHPSIPVDRHVFVKRVRIWANADRFITPLNAGNLQSFEAGPPARWEFAAIAGDGRFARIELVADMLDQRNTTVFSLRLLDTSKPFTELSVTVRFDIEDRNFHSETHRTDGADYHFARNTRPLEQPPGFEFHPASDRHLRVYSTAGRFHSAPEWSTALPHLVEQTRGQTGEGDGYSPGWFEIGLSREVPVFLVVDAEAAAPSKEQIAGFAEIRRAANLEAEKQSGLNRDFGRQLALATRAYVVRRSEGKSVIAGYPWFLDWGRDSLICARGLIAAGMLDEVRDLLLTFGRFERDGTLPNTIHGEDASNRDTSDAPLWYGVVVEELATAQGPGVYELKVDAQGRTVADVLRAIAAGYIRTTPNRIHVDAESGLVWSPSHFTWMDTNYPPGTPREGYPIEIQALWIRLLEQLERIGAPPEGESWRARAALARASLIRYFWMEEKGWFGDVLLAAYRDPASKATLDDALRSNCVIPIMFDQTPKPQARRCLQNILRHLVVPGALRSLAPLPVNTLLPIYGPDWRLLNDPKSPYWGRYEGDEDTRRKPAYHNGTAWTWTFPGLCEALARAWDFSPVALEAARSYLGSMDAELAEGCIGHIPEVLDGDAPHAQRGCDAQAWGATEALRVWKLLNAALTTSAAHTPDMLRQGV